MIRLDKYMAMCALGTRSEVKRYIRQGLVCVNGIPVRCDDLKINEDKDNITFEGQPLVFKKNVYIVINKPKNCICTTDEEEDGTIITDYLDEFMRARKLFPVGRLDADSEGLLILTDDGDFCHNVITPKKHVPKTYYVEFVGMLSDKEIQKLMKGVKIGDYTTLPSKVKRLGEQQLEITIHEGKYHQIKLMLEAIGNRVTYLKRIKIGDFDLPEMLMPGEYRELSQDELKMILAKQNI